MRPSNDTPMRRIFTIILLALPVLLLAQVQDGDNRYALSFNAGYAYNKTYQSYGNFDLGAYLPFNENVEAQVDMRFSTANVHSFGLQVRPKITLPVGCLYFDTRLLYRDIARNEINEYSGDVLLGYRMQYINVAIGCGMRVITPFHYEWHSVGLPVLEPFIFTYKVEGFVRPQTSKWNLSLCITNIDDYQIERVWQPLFMLGGWYNIDHNWRVRLSTECKPTGMFHLNAAFYGIDVRAGVEYRFN